MLASSRYLNYATLMTSDYAIELVQFDVDSRLVSIRRSDGQQRNFPYIWLRHSHNYPVLGRPEQSDDACCRIPETPEIPVIDSITLEDDEIVIQWSHDNSITRHLISVLFGKNNFEPSATKIHRPVLWNREKAIQFSWHDVSELRNPATLLRIFKQLKDYGIVLLKNLPIEPNTLFDIVRHFGPVRRTHFGEIFDIRSQPPDQLGTGANIGATASNSQAPHMDEGWRHGPPGISFFHCLKAVEDAGGSSQFVDGIAAAESLRLHAPNSFNFLSSVPLIMAAERNSLERFRSRARVIATDHHDIVRGVRISDRNFPPIDLRAEQIEPAYQAMHDLAKQVYSGERVFEHQLRPGELAIFDNHRVLHARRAFNPAAGERWIQQLSVDREEFHNIFRQLGERLNDESVIHWEPDAGLLSQPSTC